MAWLRWSAQLIAVIWIGILAAVGFGNLQEPISPIRLNLYTHGGHRIDTVRVDSRSNIAHRHVQLYEVNYPSPQNEYVFPSPDGTVTATTRYDESRDQYDLHLVSGGDDILISESVGVTVYWSPDGNTLYYYAFLEGDTQAHLWLYDRQTGAAQLFIATAHGRDSHFNCSRVDAAFCWIETSTASIAAINLNNRGKRQFERVLNPSHARWAHETVRLAFVTTTSDDIPAVQFYDPENDSVDQVTSLGSNYQDFTTVVLRWSDDDRWVTVNTTLDWLISELSIISVGSASPHVMHLTDRFSSTHCLLPNDWSQDGSTLILEVRAGCTQQTINTDLYAFSTTDATLTQITSLPNMNATHAAWSPEGNQIAVFAEQVANGHLQHVELHIYDVIAGSQYQLHSSRVIPLELYVFWSDATLTW